MQRFLNLVDLENPRLEKRKKILQNKHLLAKICFDDAENEPFSFNFVNFSSDCLQGFNFDRAPAPPRNNTSNCFRVVVKVYKPLRLLSSDYHFSLFCGSFSAVSKPNFASKYSFCSIFQDLHNEHAFAPPTTQNLQTFAQFCKFLMTFPDFLKILLKFDKIVLFFGENFTEFRRNSRESQLIYGNSDFFRKSGK